MITTLWVSYRGVRACMLRSSLDRGVHNLSADDQPPRREVRVVPVQGPDAGAPDQELFPLEAPAENPVGGGAERDRKGQ